MTAGCPAADERIECQNGRIRFGATPLCLNLQHLQDGEVSMILCPMESGKNSSPRTKCQMCFEHPVTVTTPKPTLASQEANAPTTGIFVWEIVSCIWQTAGSTGLGPL